MKVDKSTIVKLNRKVSRELELPNRVSYNRVHDSKKAYKRKKFKVTDI